MESLYLHGSTYTFTRNAGLHSNEITRVYLHIYTKQGIQRKKIDELACFLLCFPTKQKICELRYPLDPLISPFRAHGGPVDT